MLAVAPMLELLSQGTHAVHLRSNHLLELGRLCLGRGVDLLHAALDTTNRQLHGLQTIRVLLFVGVLLDAVLGPGELELDGLLHTANLSLGAARDLVHRLLHGGVRAHELLQLVAALVLGLL